MSDGAPQPSIVIFDGVCNLCNGAVNFIIRRDPDRHFVFVPTQSQAGKALLAKHGIEHISDDSFVLVSGDTFELRTNAALSMAAKLTWPWRAFSVLRILPVGFRDWFYDGLARRRYDFFGRREVCMVPSDTVRSRFLEDLSEPAS